MQQKFAGIRLATAAMVAAAALAACGGNVSISIGWQDDWPPEWPEPAQGALRVSITDAPACGFDAVYVSVAKVRVHRSAGASASDGGWTDISLNPARKINLLDLSNGALDVLGTVFLPSGRYNQLRLVLDTASVVPRGGTEQDLDTLAAMRDGIKMAGRFDVPPGQQTDIVIGFDACKSVLTMGSGHYALRPAARLVPAALNGIAGAIGPAMLDKNVVISAQQDGVVVGATVPRAGNGEFLLARLAPGNYDVVITADGSSAGVIGGVPVATASSTTVVSSAAAPIVLPASLGGKIGGSVRLVPASATEGAYVYARQTIGAGPTVTIHSAGADLFTGAYSLDGLPLSAPQYAAYSASLPQVFAPATLLTPGVASYRVDAAANGYPLRSFAGPVDIALANASNINIDLFP